MTTRREFVGTVGAAAASIIPLKFAEAEPLFDLATMETTHVYPLNTPLEELWADGVGAYTREQLDDLDAWRLTQGVLDWFQGHSIDAYLIDCPSLMIAGKPHCAKTKKLKTRWVPDGVKFQTRHIKNGIHEFTTNGTCEELGWEFAWEVKGRARGDEQWGGESRSIGILGFGATPLFDPDHKDFYSRRGIVVRYLISKTPAHEVLRLAELTRKYA